MTRTPTRLKSQKDLVATSPPSAKYSTDSATPYVPSVNIYYRDTRAKVQVIWTEKRGTQNDGFMNALRVAVENDTSHPIRESGVIYVGSRRRNKEENIAVFNTNKGQETQWPRLYFVRVNADEMGDQSRLDTLPDRMKPVLTAIATLMNKAEIEKAAERMSGLSPDEITPRLGAPWQKLIVPDDFDKTGMRILSLDHFILDDHIIELVKMLYEVDDDDYSTWARDNMEIARQYFSEPFPPVAVRELGYPESIS